MRASQCGKLVDKRTDQVCLTVLSLGTHPEQPTRPFPARASLRTNPSSFYSEDSRQRNLSVLQKRPGSHCCVLWIPFSQSQAYSTTCGSVLWLSGVTCRGHLSVRSAPPQHLSPCTTDLSHPLDPLRPHSPSSSCTALGHTAPQSSRQKKMAKEVWWDLLPFLKEHSLEAHRLLTHRLGR